MRVIGPGVFSGVGGFLHFLEVMVLLLGLGLQGAGNLLEQVLVPYSSRLIFDWGLPGGALLQKRRLVDAVRDHSMLPGPSVIWASGWVSVPPAVIVADDVSAWPCSLGIF